MGAGPEHVQSMELGQAQVLLVSNISIMVSILVMNVIFKTKRVMKSVCLVSSSVFSPFSQYY